jgi:prolipoprotein diacylglyceryltransferase
MYERFHPTFFYESMWSLVTCVVLVYLIWRYRDRIVPGIIAGIYFISYSTIRFLLEFIRLDSPAIGNITIAQIVALAVIVVWIGLIILRVKTYKKPSEASASDRVPASDEVSTIDSQTEDTAAQESEPGEA